MIQVVCQTCLHDVGGLLAHSAKTLAPQELSWQERQELVQISSQAAQNPSGCKYLKVWCYSEMMQS
jgi:hypothetical protein